MYSVHCTPKMVLRINPVLAGVGFEFQNWDRSWDSIRVSDSSGTLTQNGAQDDLFSKVLEFLWVGVSGFFGFLWVFGVLKPGKLLNGFLWGFAGF